MSISRHSSTATFGTDFRGTPSEGVIIRTLDTFGRRTDQADEVIVGFRNYAEAIDVVHELRSKARLAESGEWWLAFEASGAAAHLAHYGHEVPAELATLAEVEG